MNIPEINESQLKLMRLVCMDPDMSVFSQCSSKEGDDLVPVIAMEQARVDADRLVSLGFLKDITEDHKERITKVNADTGRMWRVLEVTALGRAMFQAFTSPTIH